MQLHRLIGALGAEVRGLALADDLDGDVFAALNAAWHEHGLLVFRDQDLDPAALAAFAGRFGALGTYPFVAPLPGHPHVIPVIKEADQRMNFGGAWHSDTAYLPRPPRATCLYAVEIPPRGGDTLFADMRLAFEALSGGMQAMLAERGAVFSAAGVHGATGAYTTAGDHPMARRDDTALAESEIEHPLVRTQPHTGRRAIYCSPTHTTRLAGMHAHESRPLLEWLYLHCTAPEFVTRLRWAPGTVAIWDNRVVQHHALNDYAGARREMWRVIVEDEDS
ncbi:MAG TPA: TauD/TfdA family dioxygenase [Pseudomonadales bacterium]|nr:TauD/TfdA family dioxygenase [Pseudomonadales bacterium]